MLVGKIESFHRVLAQRWLDCTRKHHDTRLRPDGEMWSLMMELIGFHRCCSGNNCALMDIDERLPEELCSGWQKFKHFASNMIFDFILFI